MSHVMSHVINRPGVAEAVLQTPLSFIALWGRKGSSGSSIFCVKEIGKIQLHCWQLLTILEINGDHLLNEALVQKLWQWIVGG